MDRAPVPTIACTSQDKYLRLLFLEQDNLNVILRAIYTIHRQHSGRTTYDHFRLAVTDEIKQWADHHIFHDASDGCNALEALEYYNRRFIRTYDPSRSDRTHEHILEGGDPQPDVDVMRRRRRGGMTDGELRPEDYGRLDLFNDKQIFASAHSQRRGRGNKGINNPHILGAQRRHYERDNAEGLRLYMDQEGHRPHGYDMRGLTSGTYGEQVTYRR
jgi:hypothetical protein